jgi:hypothetical protein
MPDEANLIERLQTIRCQERVLALLEKAVLLTLFRHL